MNDPARLASLEANVEHIRDAQAELSQDFKQHIKEEAQTQSHLATLANRSSQHTEMLEKMTNAVEQIAANNTRVAVLETHHIGTSKRLDSVEADVEETKDGLQFLLQERGFFLKILAGVSVLISAAWAVFTFFTK